MLMPPPAPMAAWLKSDALGKGEPLAIPRFCRRCAGDRTEWGPLEERAGGEVAGRDMGVAAAAVEACERGVGLEGGGRDEGVGVDIVMRRDRATRGGVAGQSKARRFILMRSSSQSAKGSERDMLFET